MWKIVEMVSTERKLFECLIFHAISISMIIKSLFMLISETNVHSTNINFFSNKVRNVPNGFEGFFLPC